jgi:hypothetical protein
MAIHEKTPQTHESRLDSNQGDGESSDSDLFSANKKSAASGAPDEK